jgi:hypothetical protein
MMSTQTMEVSHRVLRRADWRFLLDTPQIGVTLCLADGMLRESVERVSQSMADRDSCAREDCDLFVATDPTAEMLENGWSRLRSGGSCYTEWTVRGDSTRPQSLLEAAGFEQVELYRPWPSIDQSHVWFPAAAPTLAEKYFGRQIAASRGLLRRVIRSARYAAFHLSRHGLVTTRVAAIARKRPAIATPGGAHESVVMDAVARTCVASEPSQPPLYLRRVMYTGGPRASSKVVVLVYAESEKRPRLVVKGARVSGAAAGLVRERETLDFLHHGSAVPLDGVPRAFLASRQAGVHVLCESALDGVPITPQMAITRYGEIAEAATDWLIRLATMTATDDSSHAHWRAMVERLVRRFRRFYGAVAHPGLLSRITDMLQRVAPPACVCEHRDFSPWNLLIDDRGHLAAADWESSRIRGVAGPDLIYFLTYLAFYRDGLLGARSARVSTSTFRSAYRQAWTMKSETGRINNACFARYSRALALEPAAAPPLRMLTWLIHTGSEYRRAREDSQGNPNPESLSGGLFLNLLQLECDGSVAGPYSLKSPP